MRIKDITKESKGIELQVEIVELSPPRDFKKFNDINYVRNAVIQDKTGSIKLALWNEQTTSFNKGDRIHIRNGYVREWKGEIQVNSKDISLIEQDPDEMFHIKRLGKNENNIDND
jgi:replication factor A1